MDNKLIPDQSMHSIHSVKKQHYTSEQDVTISPSSERRQIVRRQLEKYLASETPTKNTHKNTTDNEVLLFSPPKSIPRISKALQNYAETTNPTQSSALPPKSSINYHNSTNNTQVINTPYEVSHLVSPRLYYPDKQISLKHPTATPHGATSSRKLHSHMYLPRMMRPQQSLHHSSDDLEPLDTYDYDTFDETAELNDIMDLSRDQKTSRSPKEAQSSRKKLTETASIDDSSWMGSLVLSSTASDIQNRTSGNSSSFSINFEQRVSASTTEEMLSRSSPPPLNMNNAEKSIEKNVKVEVDEYVGPSNHSKSPVRQYTYTTKETNEILEDESWNSLNQLTDEDLTALQQKITSLESSRVPRTIQTHGSPSNSILSPTGGRKIDKSSRLTNESFLQDETVDVDPEAVWDVTYHSGLDSHTNISGLGSEMLATDLSSFIDSFFSPTKSPRDFSDINNGIRQLQALRRLEQDRIPLSKDWKATLVPISSSLSHFQGDGAIGVGINARPGDDADTDTDTGTDTGDVHEEVNILHQVQAPFEENSNSGVDIGKNEVVNADIREYETITEDSNVGVNYDVGVDVDVDVEMNNDMSISADYEEGNEEEEEDEEDEDEDDLDNTIYSHVLKSSFLSPTRSEPSKMFTTPKPQPALQPTPVPVTAPTPVPVTAPTPVLVTAPTPTPQLEPDMGLEMSSHLTSVPNQSYFYDSTNAIKVEEKHKVSSQYQDDRDTSLFSEALISQGSFSTSETDKKQIPESENLSSVVDSVVLLQSTSVSRANTSTITITSTPTVSGYDVSRTLSYQSPRTPRHEKEKRSNSLVTDAQSSIETTKFSPSTSRAEIGSAEMPPKLAQGSGSVDHSKSNDASVYPVDSDSYSTFRIPPDAFAFSSPQSCSYSSIEAVSSRSSSTPEPISDQSHDHSAFGSVLKTCQDDAHHDQPTYTLPHNEDINEKKCQNQDQSLSSPSPKHHCTCETALRRPSVTSVQVSDIDTSSKSKIQIPAQISTYGKDIVIIVPQPKEKRTRKKKVAHPESVQEKPTRMITSTPLAPSIPPFSDFPTQYAGGTEWLAQLPPPPQRPLPSLPPLPTQPSQYQSTSASTSTSTSTAAQHTPLPVRQQTSSLMDLIDRHPYLVYQERLSQQHQAQGPDFAFEQHNSGTRSRSSSAGFVTDPHVSSGNSYSSVPSVQYHYYYNQRHHQDTYYTKDSSQPKQELKTRKKKTKHQADRSTHGSLEGGLCVPQQNHSRTLRTCLELQNLVSSYQQDQYQQPASSWVKPRSTKTTTSKSESFLRGN